MKISTIIFIVFIIIASTSCKKSEDSANDYASKVIGTYGGAVPPGILSGTLILSRQSNTSVNIDLNGTQYENALVSVGDSGTYNISFNTLQYQLASGVYFYKLETGEFVQTKKMLLLR